LVGTWDRVRLEQVVTNLLSNAIKYGEGKPVRVLVVDSGEVAEVVVEDHGVGISREDQQKLFRRFERASPTEKVQGFGLGLWITRQIVEAHGGNVTLVSSPGEGTTVTVRLSKQP
jgi:signal transduction histidine kinase